MKLKKKWMGKKVIPKQTTIIPESETWLYKNRVAYRAVKRGLEQAKQKIFAAEDPLIDEV